MAKYTNLSSLFTAIADAIRAKKGTTAEIVADNFPDEIAGIESGIDTTISSNAATASDIRSGKKAWVNDSLLTGNVTARSSSDLSVSGAKVSVPAGIYSSATSKSVLTATQATPSVTVSSSGLITASATQSAGYVSSGTKSDTKQLSSSDDADFIPSNIKSGVTIFGVQGTYSPSANIPTCSIKFTCADHIPSNYGIVLIQYSEYYSFMQATAISPLDTRTHEISGVAVNSVFALVTNFDPNVLGQDAGTFEILGGFGGSSYFVTTFFATEAAANNTVYIILST